MVGVGLPLLFYEVGATGGGCDGAGFCCWGGGGVFMGVGVGGREVGEVVVGGGG